jgi:hypothetical protein
MHSKLAKFGWVLVAASLGWLTRKYNGWIWRLQALFWPNLFSLSRYAFICPCALASLNTFGSIIGHQQLSLPFSHLQPLLTHPDFQLVHLSCTPIFACMFLSLSSVTCSINNFCVWLGPAFLSWQLPQKPWVITASRTSLVSLSSDPALTLGSYHYVYLPFTWILLITTSLTAVCCL